ncbi:hypothetical protein HJC23_013806 [Cyclotella cryptica]|uniref:Uncharacterized protein n=1 Tax=Cyclotella cryptica TaxID=29204 RepID=A0ABD3NSM2_9STRA
MTTNNNGNNNVEVETTNDETENDQTPLSSSSTIPIPTASGDDEVHVITTNHVVPHIPTPRRHSPQPPTTATPRYPPPPRPSNRPRHRRPWRFIRHAKKTAGYSTSSAGRIVEGLTSEELAATYVPPRLDSEGNDKEAREVGRLDIVDSGVVAVDNDGGGGGGGGKWRRCLDRTCNEDEDEEKVSEDSSVENSRVFAQAMDGCVKVECDSASQVKVITELTAVSKDEQESDKLTNDVSITEEINSNDCQTIPSDNKPITINDSAIIPSPNKEPLTNNRKRNRACLLLVFLLIAMVGMILGVTIGNSNESESAIQRKGAEAAVDVNGKDAAPPMSAPSLSLVNGTSNPSTTLGAFSSLAPSWNRSMVRRIDENDDASMICVELHIRACVIKNLLNSFLMTFVCVCKASIGNKLSDISTSCHFVIIVTHACSYKLTGNIINATNVLQHFMERKYTHQQIATKNHLVILRHCSKDIIQPINT